MLAGSATGSNSVSAGCSSFHALPVLEAVAAVAARAKKRQTSQVTPAVHGPELDPMTGVTQSCKPGGAHCIPGSSPKAPGGFSGSPSTPAQPLAWRAPSLQTQRCPTEMVGGTQCPGHTRKQGGVIILGLTLPAPDSTSLHLANLQEQSHVRG